VPQTCIQGQPYFGDDQEIFYQSIKRYNNTIVQIFSIGPHLDYCVQAWRLHLTKDIQVLEKVQRRATRFINECEGMTYEERLRPTGLTILETRRLRADLLEVYNILNGFEGTDEMKFSTKEYRCLCNVSLA